MPTRYVDHSIYAAPVAAGTVPTAAEDGNGKGKTAATMATLVITFTGIPAADGTITIGGVTFTAKASGATGNQFNAVTDAATSAANLRTAINASTTNSVAPVGAIAAVAPLRNVVNATVSGAVVTVYTRCAGSEWNSVTENSTLTNASITSQWAGGTDGSWGYFFNTASIGWPTSQATAAYGVNAGQRPYVGSFAAGDKVIVRSAKTLTAPSNATFGSNVGLLSVATRIAPCRFVIDDGTEWPADGSTPVFTINWTTNSVNYQFNLPPYTSINAKKYATTYGFTLNILNEGRMSAGKSREFVGCSFVLTGSGGGFITNQSSGDTDGDSGMTHFRECLLQQNTHSVPLFAFDATYANSVSYCFTECVLSNPSNSSANSGIIAVNTVDYRAHLFFDSCSFESYQPGSRLIVNTTDGRTKLNIFLRNCNMGNISVLGPNANLAAGINRVVAGSSQFSNRDFFVDTMFGFVEWNSSRSFPYCNARLLDGTTGWAIRMIPTTSSGRNSRFQFVETPRIGKINSLADGIRTLNIELAIHDSLTWDKSHISAVIDYIDTNGARQVVDTYDYDGGALTSSTATWNQEVSGQVTFVDGSTQYHNKYKFSVTTPTSIATETEIGIVIRCHTFVDSVVKGAFIDPEIQVT